MRDMIGYDIGAHFDLDDALARRFGDVDAPYSENYENLLPVAALIDTIAQIGPLPSSSNVAEPDTALKAATELLAGTPGPFGTGAGSEVDAPSHGKGSSLNPNHPGAVQQILAGYSRDGINAPVGGPQTALIHPDHGGTLADMPWGFGGATGTGNADMIGNVFSALIGAPVQKSNFERDRGFSLVDEVNSAAQNGQGGFYAPDIPGLAKGQLDADDTYPQLPQAVERGEEPNSVLDAMGRFDGGAKPETSYDVFAPNIAGGRLNALDELMPTGIAANSTTQPDNGLRVGAGLFDQAPHDQIIRAFRGSFTDSLIRNGAVKEGGAADVEAAITGFDQRTSVGAAGTGRRENVQDWGSPHKSSLQLPEGPGSNADEASEPQPDLSIFLPLNKIPDDEGITSLSGMWEMLRNAERFLPKQSILARRGEAVTAPGLTGAPEPGLPGLTGRLSSRGNANEHGLDDLDMRATRISPDGGRSGPSGHKNDPIYMVAINRAEGTLMPIVPTSGTSTRSPAMPGQRNLP